MNALTNYAKATGKTNSEMAEDLRKYMRQWSLWFRESRDPHHLARAIACRNHATLFTQP